MRIIFLLTALVGLLLLSITLNAVREADPVMAEKPDFFYEDFANGATVIGSWQGKNYVIKMQIKTLKLDLKLVVRETSSAQGDIYSTFQEEQNHDSQTCFNPESVPLPNHYNNQTCEPRPLSLTEETWNTLSRNTAAITAWTWNGLNRASKTTVDFVATMTCKFCGGVKFTAEWLFDEVPFMAGWTWQRILWMAQWTWNNAADFAEWTWCQFTQLANGIWDTIAWMINFCFTSICAFIDTVSELYAVYVKSHVTYIRSLFGGITRQEIIRTLITSVVLVCTLLFINKTIRYVIRRRRQARLEKESSERVVAAASHKPIWRPKPKKKKKIDKKGW